MKTQILCDFNNLAHMCWYPAVYAHSKNPDYDLVEVFKENLDLKLRSLSNALLDFRILNAEFVFVLDENSIRKILLYPHYKCNHGKNEVPVLEGAAHVRGKGYGRFCCSPGNEADDAIATLAKETGGVIVSMDKDLWQLIDHRDVHVLDPLNKSFIRREDVERAFKLSDPKHIVLHKTLWGDAGDSVPNAVPRMHRYLLPIIRKTLDGTLESFTANLIDGWDSLSLRCKELYHENQEQVHINYQLVKLDDHCDIEWE